MHRASSATGWARNPDGTLGWIWNPITGCLNGCPYCYARKLAHGRVRERYLANENFHHQLTADLGQDLFYNIQHGNDPFYPRFWPERLYIPFNGKPKGIFLCDMGELFGNWIPREWQEDIFRVIKLHPQDRFYLLTKQPQNLIKWSPFPGNCWVGVSVTSNAAMTMAYYGLNGIKAGHRFISFEPLLGQIGMSDHTNIKGWVDWVIIGACTGTKTELLELCQRWNIANSVKTSDLRLMSYGNKWTLQPRIEWVQEIVEAADRAGVAVFQKDNLIPLLPEDEPFYRCGSDGDWRLRQELPGEGRGYGDD